MKTESERLTPRSYSGNQKDASAGMLKRVERGTIPALKLKAQGRNRRHSTLLIGVMFLLVALAALFTWTSPALASIVSSMSVPVSTQENLWASVNVAKPSITPIDVSVFAPQTADSPASAPSDAPTSTPTDPTVSAPTDMPILAATEAPTVMPEATETPGALAMEIVADTPTSQSVSSAETQVQYPAEGNGERWIDVDLSEQRVYAYEGDTAVNSFLVSTGLPATPTITGEYKIYVKVRVQDMSGPGYYLRDVPYVMFFYEGYGFHGTYWHNNFGTPMSRGCVNLTIPDSEWLYNWASVGTVVNVHY